MLSRVRGVADVKPRDAVIRANSAPVKLNAARRAGAWSSETYVSVPPNETDEPRTNAPLLPTAAMVIWFPELVAVTAVFSGTPFAGSGVVVPLIAFAMLPASMAVDVSPA